MHPSLEQNRPAVVGLCRRYRVRRLDVFGSAAGDRFDPARSDFDFLVEFEDLPPADYAAAFFDLLAGLQALFGRPVDLLTTVAITNPFFRASIERTRAALYAA